MSKEALAKQEQEVPEGYKFVLVPNESPTDEPNWDECIRQAEVSTGLKVERHTLSIVIREVRRWLIAKQEQGEPVGFKIYKPTPPRGAISNVRDAELPWVYDQDPSSGNVASMWVTPVKTTPQQPVIDKSAAIRIATALGWTPPKQEQGEPQPTLYVKDIDGNFHLHKEKGHTKNCAALGDDCCPENHLPPFRVGVGETDYKGQL